MILNFIVLGLIPGTNFQITYIGLLLFVEFIVGLIALYVLLDILWLKPHIAHYIEQQQIEAVRSETRNAKARTKRTSLKAASA